MSQQGESSKEMTTLKNLSDHMLEDDVTVVGFFSSDEDAAYDLYQELSKFT